MSITLNADKSTILLDEACLVDNLVPLYNNEVVGKDASVTSKDVFNKTFIFIANGNKTRQGSYLGNYYKLDNVIVDSSSFDFTFVVRRLTDEEEASLDEQGIDLTSSRNPFRFTRNENLEIYG